MHLLCIMKIEVLNILYNISIKFFKHAYSFFFTYVSILFEYI